MRENPGQKVEDVNTHCNNETPSTGAEWQTVVDQEQKEKVIHTHTDISCVYPGEAVSSFLCVRQKPQRPIGEKPSNSDN